MALTTVRGSVIPQLKELTIEVETAIKQLSTIQETVAEIESSVSDMDNDINSLNTRVSTLESSVTAMGASISVLKSKVLWVTPEEYGAIGDGITDDLSAMQQALNTGMDVYCKANANYKLSGQLIFPWNASTQQVIHGNGCTFSVGNTRKPVFAQRMSDNTVGKTTIRKSFYDLKLKGVITPSMKWLNVSDTDGFWMQDGKLINCSAIGFSTGASIMGNVIVQAFVVDSCRNAGMRTEGNFNKVYGLFGGWTAGDTLIIKSDHSYYADIYGEYAGVIPKNTEEPGTAQGSLISFAQDGANAGGNVINGAACRYFGAGAITINGTENHVGGVLNIGSVADSTIAYIDRYDPAIYMSGTNCSIGDVTADLVYKGVQLHNASVNCKIGVVTIGSVSDINPSCQALVASGTCTNCVIQGLIVSNITKADSIYISMADLTIGNIVIRNFNIPNVIASYGIKILGACTINSLIVNCNVFSSSTLNTVFINAAARINNLTINDSLGTSLIVADNAMPLLGTVMINPRSNNSSRPIDLISLDGTAVRYIQNLMITGTAVPRANGILHIGSYRGSAWQRSTVGVAFTVFYPPASSQAVS